MDIRFAMRRKKLLDDAAIRPQLSKGLPERMAHFLEPYAQSLGRKDRTPHMQTYLRGLLSDLERKNAESTAYMGDQKRKTMQHFIGTSVWDHKPMIHQLCREVGAELGEEDGVLIFDPSAFEKCGNDSVGVARQWFGRQGKVDNGQVDIYLAYASRKGYTLCDTRLYLPKEWTNDRARCKKTGVPKDVRHQTRHELALEILDARGHMLPHAWITGDDEMGRPTHFRRAFRERGERYLVAVPSNTAVRDLEAKPPVYSGHGAPPQCRFMAVNPWREKLPEEAWTTVTVRDGDKKPLEVRITKCRVHA